MPEEWSGLQNMTRQEFKELTQSKIVILDGATGSNLQKKGMPSGVCPETWMLENREAVIELQADYLEAGSDIILAPTFTANRLKLAEYGLEDSIENFNKELVALSKEAVKRYERATDKPRKVYIAGDLTMTGVQVRPLGTLDFEDLVDVYKEQIKYLCQAGVDLLIIETMMSLQESRAALLAAKETCDLPVLVSLTLNENGRTIYGTDAKTAIIVLQSMGADAVGVNCSTGPEKMYEFVSTMKKYAYVPVLVKPNAGIPKLIGNETVFPMEAEEFADEMLKLVNEGAGIIGGCCGTTPRHIELLAEKVKGHHPSPLGEGHIRALTTERNTLEIKLDGRLLVVGERINPTGKKALQEELREGEFNIVTQMAEEQVQQGADILDINIGMSGIDEKELMPQVMEEVLQSVNVPLCIDSSNSEAIEAALRLYPGRALINSISLEKGKAEKLLPIAKKYGAMFILLPLSEKGLPKDMEEKKQIISTIIDRALEIGLRKEDIIVDGLVTTIGANPKAAKETIETIQYCKETLGVATIVGLSNISFGLPQRQFINSTFLSFIMQAGLTMAIANPSQDLLMNTALAADLLLGNDEDAANRYITEVRASVQFNKVNDHANTNDNIIDIRNESHIYEAVLKGNRKNILALVEEELEEGTEPGHIIDKMLIPAINEVGELYDKQIYFLPQLIASAKTMEIAIAHLEPMLEKQDNTESKGTIIMATVKGDIHDIGKNLVVLMLKNYGYRVIDLGKDVPADKIIQTAKDEDADIIGLSALMTTTMVEMRNVIKLVKEAGLRTKVIIGGAVITEGYAKEIGADGYSPDAQSAVRLVERCLSQQ